MCHGAAVAAFPVPQLGHAYKGHVSASVYGSNDAAIKIAILPDIFGCNPFYQGLATRYAERGAHVYLVDTFAGLGELKEMTHEYAISRRDKVRDKTFMDAFEAFAREEGMTGIMGFCLGGLYIFELARRNIPAAMVGLYGFPQGLPNDDPLDAPFSYLPSITQPFTMLMGEDDASVTRDVTDQLRGAAPSCPALDLKVYPDADHGFLPEISSDDPAKRAIAEDALSRMDAVLL